MPAASRTTGVPAEKRRTRGAPRSPGRLYDEIPLARRLHDLQRTRHLHLSRRDTLLELRPRVLTRPELVRSVTRLHAGGLSIRTIADRLNVSRSAVARIITKLTPKET